MGNSYDKWLQTVTAQMGVQATYRRFDIRDMGAPADELMVSILDAIDAAMHAGETVYVHCFAGLGRTGTVVGCWLARHGTTGQAALDELNCLRTGRSGAAPQTDAQRQFVLGWQAGA
ncbi:MAG: dual specificity protein phosphatase family protein [Anaerolineae bacterium]|nr:dual specificity protein phosphatase family protein [Anaerolineae bacterium]